MKQGATYKTAEHQLARTGNGWTRTAKDGDIVWQIIRTNGRAVAVKSVRATPADRRNAARLIIAARKAVRGVNLRDAQAPQASQKARPVD